MKSRDIHNLSLLKQVTLGLLTMDQCAEQLKYGKCKSEKSQKKYLKELLITLADIDNNVPEFKELFLEQCKLKNINIKEQENG